MSQQSFAAAMTDLEEVVRKLEQGDVPLEEAIDLYKKAWNSRSFAMRNLRMQSSNLFQ